VKYKHWNLATAKAAWRGQIRERTVLSGIGYSLWILVLARAKTHRLERMPLNGLPSILRNIWSKTHASQNL